MIPAGAEGESPEPLLFLTPRRDYEIIDVWHTFGLRGTGSNDIVVNDVFVPAHRTLKLDPGILSVPREQRPGAPVYRLPRSEEHTSELQSLMRISYAVFCLKTKTT